MFSVVLPTIWSPKIEDIDGFINKLQNCDLVDEIILINNAPQKYSGRYSVLSKIRELKYDNIYVNPAWNVGVYQSKNELVCILNDDVDFNLDVFGFMKEQLDRDDVKIIGASKSSYHRESDGDFNLEKVKVRNSGWACIMFFKKKNWTIIPSDLKIYFGDDYLIKKLEGFVWKIEGLKIKSDVGVSINSNPHLNSIIEQDTKNSLIYGLPWSSDC
jgi:hypothetical protein